jgi:formiminoglutamate deiminase
MTAYWLERAWLGEGPVVGGVLVTVEGGRFAGVEAGAEPPVGAIRLAGLTIPGFANCHSHAFHRALRGRTQQGRGSFWTWRDQMYALAGRITPDAYYELAKATYREMAATGVTTVGEFHYLHHGPDGTTYDEPNVMGLALVDAARDAGLRIALLDTCYLTSGIGSPPVGVQMRYSDGDVSGWQQRVDELAATVGRVHDVVVGAAIHSVRAVPREQMPQVADWATSAAAPLHLHLSEQVAENDACIAAYGLTPAQVFADAGALGAATSVVHATHLTDDDIELLGRSGSSALMCPTTERDLGDGIGPSRRLFLAGAPLTLGSDSHAVVDLFEEMRAVEMDERLATQERGHWSAAELLGAATHNGHRSLGFDDAGRITVGARADLVTLDPASPRTAGTGSGAEAAVFAATAADVVRVMAEGKLVATRDEQGDIGAALDDAIARCLGEP